MSNINNALAVPPNSCFHAPPLLNATTQLHGDRGASLLSLLHDWFTSLSSGTDSDHCFKLWHCELHSDLHQIKCCPNIYWELFVFSCRRVLPLAMTSVSALRVTSDWTHPACSWMWCEHTWRPQPTPLAQRAASSKMLNIPLHCDAAGTHTIQADWMEPWRNLDCNCFFCGSVSMSYLKKRCWR